MKKERNGKTDKNKQETKETNIQTYKRMKKQANKKQTNEETKTSLTMCGVIVHMAVTKFSFTDSTTYRQGSSCVEYEIGSDQSS